MAKRIRLSLSVLSVLISASVLAQKAPFEPAPPTPETPAETSKAAAERPKVFVFGQMQGVKVGQVGPNDVIVVNKRGMNGAALDDLVRRKLKVSDPRDPKEVADALRKLYADDIARLDQRTPTGQPKLAQNLDEVSSVIRLLMNEPIPVKPASAAP